MPTRHAFDYAVLRVVPRVEREEFVNAGVVLWCAERAYLGVRVHVDEARLRALWPAVDVELVRQRLAAFSRVGAGDPAGGPMARLPRRQRFHWLVAPRSTVVQVSAVHVGLCERPEETLEALFRALVHAPL